MSTHEALIGSAPHTSRVPDEESTVRELASKVAESSFGPRAKELLRRVVASESTGGVGFAAYQAPPVLKRGEGALVWDVDGKRYIDMTAAFSVANVGHCNPAVVEAVRNQAGELLHCFDLPHEGREILAAELAELAPGDHAKRVAFGVGGSDATELAMRMARLHTGAPIVLSAYGSYHGANSATAAASSKAHLWATHYPLGPHDAGHGKFPYPYWYRCPLGGGTPGESASRCIAYLRNLLESGGTHITGGPYGRSNLAAIIVEPMQGAGGYIVPDASFLRELRALCDDVGALMIVDEIQTGLGRTGQLWGCDHSDVVPDIIAVGKSLGGGLPISAVVARAEIAEAWTPGAHVSTFAATPVSVAAARASLKYMSDEALPARAHRLGEYIQARAVEFESRHEMFGCADVRGLFVGIEYVRDRDTKLPASELASKIQQRCLEQGVLVQVGGPHRNRLMLMPPLVITEDELAEAMDIIDAATADCSTDVYSLA
jgi:4-aminobutyrate aminotransferase-like enzyme